MAYNCVNIIKNLLNSDCQILNQEIIDKLDEDLVDDMGKRENLRNYLEKCSTFFNLPEDEKIYISIYSGCDYIDNIKNIGFGTLVKYFDEHDTLKVQDLIFKQIEDQLKDHNLFSLPNKLENIDEYFD